MGDDGDLGDGLGMLFQSGDQGMAHLVVGDQTLLGVGQNSVLLLGAGDDCLEGDHQVLLIDGLAALTDSPEGCFVDQVCKVCAYGTGGGLGDLLQIHIFRELDLAGVDLQGVKSALEVGTVHDDPAVKTAGTQQGLVENLGPVGGGQAHDALGGLEAVNLVKQLIQCLFLLGVGAHPGVAGAAHGVDLVDEDDAGSHLLGFLKEVADAACAHAHEHLHKVGAGDGEEGDVRLAGNGLGKEGLASTGRAHQQGTLGQLCADIGILLGIVEKIDDLLEGFLGFILAGHILEGNSGLLLHIDLGLGFAEAAHHALAAHAPGDKGHQTEDHQAHEQVVEDHHNAGIVLGNDPVHLDAACHQLVGQGHGVAAAGEARVAGFLLGRGEFCLVPGQIDDPVIVELHLRQIVGQPGFLEIGPGGLVILALADHVVDAADGKDCHHGDDQDQPDFFGILFIGPLGAVVGGIVAILIHKMARLLMISFYFAHHITFFCLRQRRFHIFAVNFL